MLYLPFYTCFSLLSLRHHSDTNISVLLSIYSHFLFSFYPRFTPKHDRLLKTCRIVLLLFLTVLPSNNIRLTVGFFPSVLQCYISIKNQCQPLLLSCFLGDFFFFPFFSDHSPLSYFLAVNRGSLPRSIFFVIFPPEIYYTCTAQVIVHSEREKQLKFSRMPAIMPGI